MESETVEEIQKLYDYLFFCVKEYYDTNKERIEKIPNNNIIVFEALANFVNWYCLATKIPVEKFIEALKVILPYTKRNKEILENKVGEN